MTLKKKIKTDSSDSEAEELINEIGLENLDLEAMDNLANIAEDCNHEFKRNKGLDSNAFSFVNGILVEAKELNVKIVI